MDTDKFFQRILDTALLCVLFCLAAVSIEGAIWLAFKLYLDIVGKL